MVECDKTEMGKETDTEDVGEFHEGVQCKVFSPLIQEKKEDEFIRLRQETQTVAEYES